MQLTGTEAAALVVRTEAAALVVRTDTAAYTHAFLDLLTGRGRRGSNVGFYG